ncbi:AraC family transcriptional regulator [Paenibacillus chondroitinus]|uniref:AraC family transcriptional regulator n=2 Tax=Paenibacillus TaxID=44249 RepID=A0ABU6DJZ1_9BACL|nr:MULTISPECIES: AraC family transcriptional regulator [Paenibacillus]MCY9661361.1 AraC family transcriptional regulator [Paenibacillus anseongense]MEB4798102.1 AraC family transcriptional regulator [Paenibacillus chondroitinus]
MESAHSAFSEIVNEEVIYQNPLLFLKIWELGSDSAHFGVPTPWLWHSHKQVEFLVVMEGLLAIQTKHELAVLSAGDVIVLGSSQPHRTYKYAAGPLRQIVFQIDLKQHFDLSTMPYLHCFSELTHPLEQFNGLFRSNPAVKQAAYELILQIFEESQSRKIGYELAISAAIKNLLLLMLRNDNRDLSALAEDSGIARLRPALDYIDNHLGERITVEEVCSLLNLSYHYFIKYFKKVMGISFVDYVNYKRIKKAERLLLTGDLSMMEVSFEVGILNMAQFYKLFKRHNQCSPKEFKQRMRSQTGVTPAPLLAQAD